MLIRNTELSWGLVSRVFHWTMAALIIFMLFLGLYMTGLPRTPDKSTLYGMHKSIGVLILMLAIARLTWRWTNLAPLLPPGMPRVVKWGAHASHFLLYAGMFAMPLTGWGMSSAGGRPVSFFGLFTLPDLLPVNRDLSRALNEAHTVIAYCLIVLIPLHAAAAVWHQVMRHDDVLKRMAMAVLPALLLLPVSGHADEALSRFTLIPEQSNLRFVATENGAPAEGGFKRFTTDILFSPDHPDQSHINVDVDMGSVTARSPDIAQNLPGAEWLDAAHFPHAVFKSTKIHVQPRYNDSPLELYVDGNLTLHGVTKPETLNIRFERYDADGAVAEGTVTLSRGAFNIGSGQWKNASAVGDMVTVRFRAALKRG